MEASKSDAEFFTKTPVPISKSPGASPSIRSFTQTVIVSLAETVTHDITYGKYKRNKLYLLFLCGFLVFFPFTHTEIGRVSLYLNRLECKHPV